MGVKVQFSTTMTRAEKWCTGVLVGLASSLFVVPSAFADWADVSMKTGGAAAVIPAGAAALWWSLKSTVDFIDANADDEPEAHLGEVLVNAAERERQSEVVSR